MPEYAGDIIISGLHLLFCKHMSRPPFHPGIESVALFVLIATHHGTDGHPTIIILILGEVTVLDLFGVYECFVCMYLGVPHA